MAEIDKKTVLIVDDAPENIDMLKTILMEEYAIKAGINGEKAWKILGSGAHVDLVLLDINMPVLDGYTLCKMIKEDEKLKEIPVIFITASHESEDEVKGFELGAADFITKPFSPIKVKARVKAHISLYEKKIKLKESLQELKNTQNQLVESQKMASLGSLAAGVAHELNTPLGISITAISRVVDKTGILKVKMEKGELKKSDMLEYLNSASDAQNLIQKNLNKSAKLVENFKAFSLHDYASDPKQFSLCEFITNMEERFKIMLQNSEPELRIVCGTDAEVCSYPEVLESILDRLVENAILHGLRDQDAGKIVIGCEEAQDCMVITIHDNGKGIPEEELEKIFQPFYTTERIQGYSGLGLSTVYNLVYHKLGGTIDVSSSDGMGTTFSLKIPKTIEPSI